jgi:hypothetical protein
MYAFVTVSDMKRLAIIVDLESGETKLTIKVRPEFVDASVTERAPCRPFGITWSRSELFIANNRQLLVFDRHFNYKGMLREQLQVNVHQLAYYVEHVWAVSPWTNSLIGVSPNSNVNPVEFDLLSSTIRPYIERNATVTSDKWHFNSLLWADGFLYVAAHAFGPFSFINQYDATTFELVNVLRNAGHSIHGLASHNGELFWISTKTNEIRSDSGHRRLLLRPGFGRGFAMTDDYFIIATSTLRPRSERHKGDSWIDIVDRRDGTILNSVCLPNSGSVNDLRLLDMYDYSHRIDPLWEKVTD